jgi:hypothetical protein
MGVSETLIRLLRDSLWCGEFPWTATLFRSLLGGLPNRGVERILHAVHAY